MITIEHALRTVLSTVSPLKTHRLALSQARGCYLAEDIRADRDLPPTDRSAMDGYVVRAKDIAQSPSGLSLAGEIPAGSAARTRVQPGKCVRIFTGSAIPPGGDTVVMVEETTERDGVVTFRTSVKTGANIRRKGEEVAKGQVVLPKGSPLHAAQIALAASVGKAALRVHKRPSIAILCTGRELKAPGAKVAPYQLRDSNGPALLAALSEAGFDDITHRIVPDDFGILTDHLAKAIAAADVVILTGGVSVGQYDYVPQAVQQIGAKVHFHGVAMKPGKPQLYATRRANRPIFGLPGNPLSVLTGFYELVLPAIRRMSGCDAGTCHQTMTLPLARSIRGKGKRANFFLAALSRSSRGLTVQTVKSCGSADLAAGAKADGMILMPRNVHELGAGGVRIGEDKMAEVSRLIEYGRERILAEIDKCVVLCLNCHRKEHR
ncbi:hypothetical protein LCGC14_2381160, partial [marine sediment metagenome]